MHSECWWLRNKIIMQTKQLEITDSGNLQLLEPDPNCFKFFELIFPDKSGFIFKNLGKEKFRLLRKFGTNGQIEEGYASWWDINDFRSTVIFYLTQGQPLSIHALTKDEMFLRLL
jgi:hypothetical protein